MAVQTWSSLKQVANEAGAQLLNELRKNIMIQKKVATGDLLRSLKYKVVPSGSNWKVMLTGNSYIGVLDTGRRRGSKPPPVSAILKWMSVRKIKPRDVRGRFVKPLGMAIAIAKKIGRDGIKGQPHHIIQNSLKILNTNSVQSKLREYIVKDIQNQLILTLKNKNK